MSVIILNKRRPDGSFVIAYGPKNNPYHVTSEDHPLYAECVAAYTGDANYPAEEPPEMGKSIQNAVWNPALWPVQGGA